jgi:hypothetical protein
MQPIAEWLDELGLGHYAQRFAENGIDTSASCSGVGEGCWQR